MRWKSEIASEYRVFLCCHVKTGTLVLGLWNIVVHICALSLLMYVAFNPGVTNSYYPQYVVPQGIEESSQYNASEAAVYNFYARSWGSDDIFFATVVTFGSFLMSLLLIYGIIKVRPSYLMPFFSLQVFDFCITFMSMVSYLSYIPNMKHWIAAQNGLPYREELLKMDDYLVSLLAIMTFVGLLLIKSYLLGMVWSCYKYLRGVEIQQARLMQEGCTQDPESAEMLLPPKYEDAIMMPVEVSSSPAPPAYTDRVN